MQVPFFTDPQFLDSNGSGGLNGAFSGAVFQSILSYGSGIWTAAGGLVAPEAMTVVFSGMVASLTLGTPWRLLTKGGLLVDAHGVQSNQDTIDYTVDFTPLIPATGSLTAYLAASLTTIMQNPFPIVGPPPGHPAYNPNFVPTVGYATNTYSVSLAAVTGQPDNANTYELLRTTLVAGQSAVTGFSTVGQSRASNRVVSTPNYITSGGTLTAYDAGKTITPTVSGLTYTLPPVTGAGGVIFYFVNPTNGNTTVAVNGLDLIVSNTVTGVASIAVPPSGSLALWGNPFFGTWHIRSND